MAGPWSAHLGCVSTSDARPLLADSTSDPQIAAGEYKFCGAFSLSVSDLLRGHFYRVLEAGRLAQLNKSPTAEVRETPIRHRVNRLQEG